MVWGTSRSTAGLLILLMWLLFCSVSRTAVGQTAILESPAAVTPTQPKLAAELLQRMDEDQAARRLFTDLLRQGQGKTPEEIARQQAAISEKVGAIDRRNQCWLEEVIRQVGWPGKSLVGERAAHAAWLLVQHADADPVFQERCLDLMKAAAPGEVALIDVAYLTDRVLVARGRPQVYGTQCEEVEGRFQPRACLDPETLDQRRKEVGLQPIKEYLQLMEDVYHTGGAESKSDK